MSATNAVKYVTNTFENGVRVHTVSTHGDSKQTYTNDGMGVEVLTCSIGGRLSTTTKDVPVSQFYGEYSTTLSPVEGGSVETHIERSRVSVGLKGKKKHYHEYASTTVFSVDGVEFTSKFLNGIEISRRSEKVSHDHGQTSETLYEFDQDHPSTTTKVYRADGQLILITINRYNYKTQEFDYPYKQLQYLYQGVELKRTIITTFKKNGTTAKSTNTYENNGEVETRCIGDQVMGVTKRAFIDVDGEKFLINEMKFNKKGRITRNAHINVDGSGDTLITYNGNGRIDKITVTKNIHKIMKPTYIIRLNYKGYFSGEHPYTPVDVKGATVFSSMELARTQLNRLQGVLMKNMDSSIEQIST